MEAVEACGLEFVEDIRESHCRRFAEGLAKSECTKDLIPPSRLRVYGRNLCNTHEVSQLHTRTLHFQNNPIPYYINLLNKLKLSCMHASCLLSAAFSLSLNENVQILLALLTTHMMHIASLLVLY